MEILQQAGGGVPTPPNPVEEARAESSTESVIEIPIPEPEPEPEPLPPLPTVKVRVANQTAQCWIDGASAPLPHMKEVIKRLPSPHNKLKTRPYEDLVDKIRQNWGIIPNSAWSNAIGQALIAQQASGPESEFESNSIQGANSFLAVGNQLFKLIPTAVTRTNGALAAVRKRAVEMAKAEASNIIAEANANAVAIASQASKALREAQEIRSRARTEMPPPEWAVKARIPLRFRPSDNGQSAWHIGFNLHVSLRRYDCNYLSQSGVARKRSWRAVAEPDYTYLLLWVPVVDGQFSTSSIYVEPRLGYCHPHISKTQACMELGIIPNLASLDDYYNLEHLLNRTLGAAQLDSLLCRMPDWIPLTKGMPAPLLEALKGGYEGVRAYALRLDQEAGITDPVQPPTPEEVFEV